MSKKDFIVIGVNDIEHERIQMALQIAFYDNLSRYEAEEKLLPKDEEFQRDVEEYFKLTLETVEESNENIKRALESSLQFYSNDYKQYVEGRRNTLNDKKHYYDKNKEFLEYINQFIKLSEDGKVITYERNEAIETFLMLIDILDLDGRKKLELEQEKIKKHTEKGE